MQNSKVTAKNKSAWEAWAYEAWVKGYGTPKDVASRLRANPAHKLRRIMSHIGGLEGTKVINPLGSNGRFAVALALLGADVTIVDISESNRKYALELADAAGVNIEYICADFASFRTDEHFDLAISELGILHYFTDLDEYCCNLAKLLIPGGKAILNEFHPLLKKAVSIEQGQISLHGSYFSSELEIADVPYATFLGDVASDLPNCSVRRWTLGETVTAYAKAGFKIVELLEEPSLELSALPGTFTLVAVVE